MSLEDRGTIIEGVGDDVVYGLLGFFVAVVPIVLTVGYWAWNRSRFQTIHPQSQTTVQGTRERLRQANRLGHRETTARPRDCPICMSDIGYAVETNCGHVFCGLCMVTYWHHGNWLGAVRCPICRQQVTIMLFRFTDEEQQENSSGKEEVIREVYRYNRRFSGEPIDWLDYLRDLPTLLRHCVREFFSVGGLIWMFRMRIIICFFAALLYFISPLDIIPEAVFGLLGLLDDLFVLLLLAIYISIIYRQVIAQRAEAAG